MTDRTKNPPFEVPLALGVSIFNILKEEIITGKLREGIRLDELALQKTFGVSRSPIREAFHRLETEGLIEITHRRGAFVRSISIRDMIEATTIRGYLEGLALRIAVKPFKPNWLQKLKHTFQEMERSKDEHEIEQFTFFHGLFHKTIIDSADNRILSRIYPSVTEPFVSDRLTYHFLDESEKFVGVDHREIYDLLASGRALEAAEMVQRHAYIFVEYLDTVAVGKTRAARHNKVDGGK